MSTKKQTPAEISRRERLRIAAKPSAKKFNNETQKALNTALIAAFGFLIALTWRDVITEYVNKLTAISPVQGKLISATIITLVGVLGILIVTYFIRQE